MVVPLFLKMLVIGVCYSTLHPTKHRPVQINMEESCHAKLAANFSRNSVFTGTHLFFLAPVLTVSKSNSNCITELTGSLVRCLQHSN